METYSRTENHSHYPDLPDIPCPRHLFISLLSKQYLAALYLVEPSIFPQNWLQMIKTNPVESWDALNQVVIRYLSSRYATQGLHSNNCDVAIFKLARVISENIWGDIKEEDEGISKTQKAIKPQNGEFDLLAEKLQIVFDLVSSELFKLTDREVTIQISLDGKAIKDKTK